MNLCTYGEKGDKFHKIKLLRTLAIDCESKLKSFRFISRGPLTLLSAEKKANQRIYLNFKMLM